MIPFPSFSVLTVLCWYLATHCTLPQWRKDCVWERSPACPQDSLTATLWLGAGSLLVLVFLVFLSSGLPQLSVSFSTLSVAHPPGVRLTHVLSYTPGLLTVGHTTTPFKLSTPRGFLGSIALNMLKCWDTGITLPQPLQTFPHYCFAFPLIECPPVASQSWAFLPFSTHLCYLNS